MSNTVTVYGISNCDTVKKARTWLDDHGIEYQFHDFRTLGVPLDHVDRWIAAVGWEALINRKGTTWRRLDSAVQDAVIDPPTARTLLQDHASVIKRPVVEWGPRITVGFDPAGWEPLASR